MGVQAVAVAAAPYVVKAGKWGAGRIRKKYQEKKCVAQALKGVNLSAMPSYRIKLTRCVARKICQGKDQKTAREACWGRAMRKG